MRRRREQRVRRPREARLDAATFGIVGLGGGGSHMVQQLAHVGVGGYVPVDPDHMTDTNANRLIGGILEDVAETTSKVEIAKRLIRGLQPHARVFAVPAKWQNATEDLKRCDVILGAVDSFIEREQLERFTRRYLIPYVDIGMDVHDLGENGHLIAGQVILSTPGSPCLRCCGLVTDERLKLEAARYATAGTRPQVVWPNGVLASTAIGLAVQLITPWFPNSPAFTYLEYDGNRGTVSVSAHVAALKGWTCPHHPPDETGDPFFDIRAHLARIQDRAPLSSPWRFVRRTWATIKIRIGIGL